MSDWDWQSENGSMSADGDYLVGGVSEVRTSRERWISRRKREGQVREFEIENLALQLIRVKQKLNSLKDEEAALKQKLIEKLPKMGWVSMVDGDGEYIVENLVRRPKPRLKTNAALNLIRKKFGDDAALYIAEQCFEKSVKHNAIYVRKFSLTEDDTAVDPTDGDGNFLFFSDVAGTGAIRCNNCDFSERVTGFLHNISEDNPWCCAGYQCQRCGKFQSVEQQLTDRAKEKCECGGHLERDKPMFCPKCKTRNISYEMHIIT